MKNEDDLYGFKVEKLEEEKLYQIMNFPTYPQKSKLSKKLYYEIEKSTLLQKDEVVFPLRFNITERLVEFSLESIDYFSLKGIKKLLEKDKDLFLKTKTFFKVKLEYVFNSPIITIIYYTICENGLMSVNNISELLDFVFITYNTKQFTQRRISEFSKFGVNFREIEQIPILPLLWLEFNDDNSLMDIQHIRLIEDYWELF